MKKIILKSLLATISLCAISLCAIIALTACDKIDTLREKQDGLPTWNGQYVLIEEFTGVRCPNCPNAAATAHELQNTFGDKLIIVAMHPTKSSLTMPNGPVDSIKDNNGQLVRIDNQNLTQADARVLMDYYQIAGLPSGCVNRQQQPGATLNPDSWYGEVLRNYSKRPIVELSAKAKLAGQQIEVDIEGSFLQKRGGNPLNLVTLVAEDSLVVVQTMPAGQAKNSAYVQNHVFRTMVDGAWGTQIVGGSNAIGDHFQKSYKIDINPLWRKNKLLIISYLCDPQTKEILQVTQTKIQ